MLIYTMLAWVNTSCYGRTVPIYIVAAIGDNLSSTFEPYL